jgi:hypothetical protein
MSHTTKIALAEEEIRIHHNGDWSGIAEIEVENFYGKPTQRYSIPGRILMAIFTRLAADVRETLQDVVEQLNWD